jgi:hypothetical protein
MNVFQQLFDSGAFADNEAPVAPFDERRASENKPSLVQASPRLSAVASLRRQKVWIICCLYN